MAHINPTEHCDLLYDQFCGDLQKEGRVNALSQKFKCLQSDQERVKFLLECPIKSLCKLDIGHRQEKSSNLSTSLRKEGNNLFQAKNYISALEKYTESIASCDIINNPENKNDECELAMGFANRSAALFHLNKFASCLKDIDYALNHGYPQQFHYKLNGRRARCLQKLGRHEEASNALIEAFNALQYAQLEISKQTRWKQKSQRDFDDGRDMKNRKDMIDDKSFINVNGSLYDVPKFQKEESHEQFCSLSSAVNVAYTVDQGRYIEAKRNIKPGEIILIEKPWASVVLHEHHLSHCHHCFQHCDNLLPCTSCSHAMFCSESCYTAATSSYHLNECSILSVIHRAKIGKFGYLALRAVLVSKIDDLLSFSPQNKQILCAQKEVQKGCNEEGLYLGCEYSTIINLVTHDDKRTVADLFRRTFNAVFLVKCLQQTNFFVSQKGNKKCDDLDTLAFIGGLILSHLQAFPCNAHEISELILDEPATSSSFELGAGIYSTLSLFNHSCDPVANRNFYGDICVVRAIKALRPGEEVSDNYGAVYAVQNKQEREQKLAPQYFFNCCCKACAEDWPLYSQLETTSPTWKCCCGSSLSQSRGLFSGRVMCDECGSEEDLAVKATRLKYSQQNHYEPGLPALLKGDVEKAVSLLLSHLDLLDETLCLPWKDYNNCQEAVKQCYSIKGNCYKK